MIGRLLAVIAIILFVFVGVGVVQQGQWDASTATQPQNTFNESVALTPGAISTLSDSDKANVVYAPQSAVTVTQNGTTIDAPGNWTWQRHNGTILILTGTTLNTTETAFVDGYYTVPSASQNTTTALGLLPTEGFGEAWLLAAMVVLVLAALAIATRLG